LYLILFCSQDKEPDVDIEKSVHDVLTNVRLNSNRKDRQVRFLQEGFELVSKLALNAGIENEEIQEKYVQVRDSVFILIDIKRSGH